MKKELLLKAVTEYEYTFGIFIELNKDGSNFQKEFIKFAPSIEADIKSSAINEECSCTVKVKNYIRDHKNECISFLRNMVESSIITDIDFETLNKKYRVLIVGGKVAKTSIKDWPEFINNLEESNATYKAMHVIKENDDVYVFFS
jgi:hypothetical protein